MGAFQAAAPIPASARGRTSVVDDRRIRAVTALVGACDAAPAMIDVPISVEAVFRYTVVSFVRAQMLAGTDRDEAIAEAAEHAHATLHGAPREVTRRTLQRWMTAFEEDGVRGLEPRARPRTTTSLVLDDKLIHFIANERREDLEASIPELLRRAKERGLIESIDEIDRTTVWRAMKRMALATGRTKRRRDRDMRRFAYPHRMQMLLFDGKHFRAGATRLKRVALIYLDDATRRALDGIVGTDEETELFLTGLYSCIRQHGLFDAAYADNGAGFASDDTHIVFASGLKVPLVNGTAGYPEGHGKIEKFNRTLLADMLRGLDGNPAVDPDCAALTLRIRHYLEHEYNPRPHESLSGLSPQERWDTDPRPLRFPESDAELRRSFVVTETRDVSADNVLRHGGQVWEVPRGHAGTTIAVHRQVLDGTLHILHEQRLVRLHPVDLTDNAYARRANRAPVQKDEIRTAPTTAAAMAFERDFAPIVGADGGFTKKENV